MMNTPLKKLLPILALILTHSVYGQIQSSPSSIELQIQTLEQKQDSLRYVMSKIEVESALEALNTEYQNEGIESPESVQKLKRLIAELDQTLENHKSHIIEKSIQEEFVNLYIGTLENNPIWPGCEGLVYAEQLKCFNERIRQFVATQFVYPEEAKQMNLKGEIWVSFRIKQDGRVDDIIIERGIDPLVDNEAIRVVRMLPVMIPAKLSAQRPVSMRLTLPIKVDGLQTANTLKGKGPH